jgi:hypothetical protein
MACSNDPEYLECVQKAEAGCTFSAECGFPVEDQCTFPFPSSDRFRFLSSKESILAEKDFHLDTIAALISG